MNIEDVFDIARKVFEIRQEHGPIVMAESSNGGTIMLRVPSMEPEEKRAALMAIGATLKTKEFIPGTIYFASEFWVKTVSKTDTAENANLMSGKKRVVDCEDKKEVLAVLASSKRGDCIQMAAEIKRGVCGKPFLMSTEKDGIVMLKSGIMDTIWDGYDSVRFHRMAS